MAREWARTDVVRKVNAREVILYDGAVGIERSYNQKVSMVPMPTAGQIAEHYSSIHQRTLPLATANPLTVNHNLIARLTWRPSLFPLPSTGPFISSCGQPFPQSVISFSELPFPFKCRSAYPLDPPGKVDPRCERKPAGVREDYCGWGSREL